MSKKLTKEVTELIINTKQKPASLPNDAGFCFKAEKL
jgi:hypothetical protein